MTRIEGLTVRGEGFTHQQNSDWLLPINFVFNKVLVTRVSGIVGLFVQGGSFLNKEISGDLKIINAWLPQVLLVLNKTLDIQTVRIKGSVVRERFLTGGIDEEVQPVGDRLLVVLVCIKVLGIEVKRIEGTVEEVGRFPNKEIAKESRPVGDWLLPVVLVLNEVLVL